MFAAECARPPTHPTTAEALLPPLGQFRNLDLQARLAQSVERQALNLMVVGSSPTVGVIICLVLFCFIMSCARALAV